MSSQCQLCRRSSVPNQSLKWQFLNHEEDWRRGAQWSGQPPILGSANEGLTLKGRRHSTSSLCSGRTWGSSVGPLQLSTGCKDTAWGPGSNISPIVNLPIDIKLTIKVMNGSNQCILLSQSTPCHLESQCN